MPGEIRLVIFNDVEVAIALTEFRKRRREPLPSSLDVTVTIRDKPRIMVTLAIVPEGKKMPLEFKFEGEELAAALIMYCIDRKIPLPATGAEKTICLVGDSVALQILKSVSKEQMEAMSDLF